MPDSNANRLVLEEAETPENADDRTVARLILERLGFGEDVGETGVSEAEIISFFNRDQEIADALLDVQAISDETLHDLAELLADTEDLGLVETLARRGGHDEEPASVDLEDAVLVGAGDVHHRAARASRARHRERDPAGVAARRLDRVRVERELRGDELGQSHVDETIVSFRALGGEEIERYLRRETPYECAGSFKAEGLGIALFERVRSEDPSALQGLPLIWLSGALRRAGVRVI